MSHLRPLSVAEVADALGLSKRAVQHRIKAGQIAATKLGTGQTSAYLIEAAEVERIQAETPGLVALMVEEVDG